MSDLSDLCIEKGLTITAKRGASKPSWDPKWPNTDWRTTLRYQGRSLTTDFYQGLGIKHPPTAADVVSALCSDARCGQDSFEEFCSNTGCDEDSRKAEQTWRACKAMAPKIKKLLGRDFDVFCDAEH